MKAGLPCLPGLRLFAELLLVVFTDLVSAARFPYHQISALSPVRPMGAVKKQVVLPESTFASCCPRWMRADDKRAVPATAR